MRMLQAFWNIAIAASLVGCHQTLLVTSPRSNPPAGGVQQVTWTNHFLYGFVGRKELDLRDYCKQSAVESVELSSSAATLALTIVTLGVYCPRRVAVVCTKGETG